MPWSGAVITRVVVAVIYTCSPPVVPLFVFPHITICISPAWSLLHQGEFKHPLRAWIEPVPARLLVWGLDKHCSNVILKKNVIPHPKPKIDVGELGSSRTLLCFARPAVCCFTNMFSQLVRALKKPFSQNKWSVLIAKLNLSSAIFRVYLMVYFSLLSISEPYILMTIFVILL